MNELSEAVYKMELAAIRLRRYIQHTCDYSTSIGASSPDSDYCTCGLCHAVTAANEALTRLRVLANAEGMPLARQVDNLGGYGEQCVHGHRLNADCKSCGRA